MTGGFGVHMINVQGVKMNGEEEKIRNNYSMVNSGLREMWYIL